MIPAELRDNWALQFGPSAVVLPKVLAEIPELDVYIHDSGANYNNQMTEFSLAVDKMRSGGVLCACQLNSDAFFEIAEGAKARWTSIDQGKPYPMGILSVP